MSRHRKFEVPVVGLANCFATRYGDSRIQSEAMQLGLRFAAAKLPGLRTDRGIRNPVEPSDALVARGGDRGLGNSTIANRHACCRIEKDSAVGSWPYTRVRNLGSANQGHQPDSYAAGYAPQSYAVRDSVDKIMEFKQREVDELLAKTARRCCLCGALHRLQVHHIVPREEGGSDEIENAIPLCPNCHDEVHKGHAPGRVSRAYTASELRMHRARTIELAHKAEVYKRDSASWRDDSDLILFFAQALDRPAFRTRFHEELNFTDFDKAMEDTLLALNTGYWRMRDGTVIGRSRGRVHLVNPAWRAKLDEVVTCIENVRLRFREALGLQTMLFRWGDPHEERRAMHRAIFGSGHRGLDGPIDSHFRADGELGYFMDHERQKAVDLLNEVLREIGHEPLPGVGVW